MGSATDQAGVIFQPHDLDRFVDLVGVAVTRDGSKGVYVANTRDGETTARDNVLWAFARDGEDARPLTGPGGSQGRPALSPDDTKVAFLQSEDGRRQICTHPLAGGEAQVLTSFPRGVGPVGPRWSPDGSTIAFDGCPEPARDPARPYRVTRPLWRRDGMGLIQDNCTEIHTVSANGGESRQLTTTGGVILFHDWSANGSQILCVSYAAPESTTYDIAIVEHPSGTVRLVTQAEFMAAGPVAAWLPEGRVAYTTPRDINRGIDLVVFDPITGSHDNRTSGLDGQLFGHLQAGFNAELFEPRVVVDTEGRFAYVYVQHGGVLQTTRVALHGEREVTTIGDTSVSHAPLALTKRGLVTARTGLLSPPDVCVTDVVTGAESVIVSLNTWLPKAPFEPRRFIFSSSDGTQVEAWFLEPRSGEAPYPTVMNIHGGPFAGYGEVFSLDNWLLSAAGYGVLLVNFRGSSGYGDEFSAVLRGDWGHRDVEDLIGALDLMVEQGLVDNDRVGSFGLSGGGYLTAWLLTHSDRFRAGIAECPVTEWSSMLASDIAAIVPRWMGSGPGQGTESVQPWVRMSPATYAADCAGPMLVVVHEGDLRCPPTQGDLLYNSLHLAGHAAELLRLPGIPHSPFLTGNYDIKVGRAEALIDWMDRHVQ